VFVTGNAAVYQGELLSGDIMLQKPYAASRLAEAVTMALGYGPSPLRSLCKG